MASIEVELNAELMDRQLGDFRLFEGLSTGGAGTVYRAKQRGKGKQGLAPMDRIAVVKVLHQRLLGRDAALARFQREAAIASRFRHSYAAHVYAFGVEPEDGLAWIAMEFVEGVTLREWLNTRGPMPIELAAEFLDKLAAVVQELHTLERCIVHRDIKPENIMVIEGKDGQLSPKLLDFGIAQMTEAVELTGEYSTDKNHTEEIPAGPRCLTPPGSILGTPKYRSPEQWRGERVGPASDLYSLGLVLYEMVTGRPPFVGTRSEELRELHLHAAVPPLGPGLPPELDAYFARALAKRPEARFDSARDMATVLRSELARTLAARVRVAARQWHDGGRKAGLLWRGDALAELERWRHSSGVALSGIELEFVAAALAARADELEAERAAKEQRASRLRRIALACGVVIAGGGLLAARQVSVRDAEFAHKDADQARRYAALSETIAEREQGRQSLLYSKFVDAYSHLWRAYQLGDHSPDLEFMLARSIEPLFAEVMRISASKGRSWAAVFSSDGKQIAVGDEGGSQLWDTATHRRLSTLDHDTPVYDVAYARNGGSLATASSSGVRLWNQTGALLHDLQPSHGEARYFQLTISPDSRLVAAITSATDRVDVWDMRTGIQAAELHPRDARKYPALAFSADARWIAMSGGTDAQVVDTLTWKQVAAISGPIRALAFDPSGPRLVSGSVDGDVSVWDMPTGVRLHHLRDVGNAIGRLVYAPSGALLAATAGDELLLWDGAGKMRASASMHGDKIQSIEFDARSERVLAALTSGSVLVLDAVTGMTVATLAGPDQLVRTAHFDASGQFVVGASWDRTTRVWSAAAPYRRWGSDAPPGCVGLVGGIEPDQRIVAVTCPNYGTRVWDTMRDQLLAELPSTTTPDVGPNPYPAVSQDGDRAAIARGNSVEVYALPGGRLLRTIARRAAVSAVSFGQSGAIVSGAVDGSVLVTEGGADQLLQPSSSSGIDAVLLLPDGRVLAADAHAVRVYAGGRLVAELPLRARLRAMRPSLDGRHLLGIPDYGGDVAPVPLWSLERYELVAELADHLGLVFAARWVGDQILTAAADGTARLWDVAGASLKVFRAGSVRLTEVAMDPTGQMVIAGGTDGALHFWDVASARPLWTLPVSRGNVLGIRFDGRDIVTRGSGGDVARWAVSSPAQVIQRCADTSLCGKVQQ